MDGEGVAQLRGGHGRSPAQWRIGPRQQRSGLRDDIRRRQRGLGNGLRAKAADREEGGVWTEKQLHVFTTGNADGLPSAGVIFDSKANLYGTTVGTIFRLVPPSTKSGRWKETILSTFNNYEAYDPAGALTFDADSNLYGTTQSAETSFGTVFRLRPPSRNGDAWAFSILYGFTGSPDGAQPSANLIFDKHGNLYSTTMRGGTGQSCQGGCGTVFEVSQ